MAESEVHLRDYLAVIRKHDFIVILSFLLISGSALIVGFYIPREYEAAVAIEAKTEAINSGLSNLMQNFVSSGVDQISMETICKRFVSRSILTETTRNLKKKNPDLQLAPPDALEPRIKAKIIPDTRMIEVSVRMRRDEGGSQVAALIANELVFVMQNHLSEKTNAEVERRQKFIDDKMKTIEVQMNNSDQDIQQFLEESGDDLVWSAKADYMLTRLSNIVQLKEQYETRLAVERKKLSELRSRRGSEPEWIEYSRTLSRDPLWDKNRSDLADLGNELAAARAEFGEKSPRVKSIEAQIKRIQEEMKNIANEAISAKTESRNPAYQAIMEQIIESELNTIAYEAQFKAVEKILNDLNKEKEQIFSEMPQSKFQLDKMRRQIGYGIDLYKILLEKRLEADIWANESSDNEAVKEKGGLEIVDMAQPNSSPVKPRVKFIGAIAGLVGLAVGLAMAFLAEYFENTYQSPEEIREDLGIPLLGTIPIVKGQEIEGGVFSVLESPMSAEAESFRTLVTNIDFSSPDRPHQALLITSSTAGEGKSFAAANLAIAMSQTKDRVILVDCDMRKAVQHKIFGINSQIGLSNVLVGNASLNSVIQDTGIPNLSLLICGPTPPNPIELLKSQKMGEILRELRKNYDLLLFDSPPVLPVADSMVLASSLDGILFVADINHTPREMIKQAQEQLSKLEAPLLGLICNKIDMARKYNSYYHRSSGQRA